MRQAKVKVQHLFQCTADRIFSTLATVTAVVFQAYVCTAEESYAFLKSKQSGCRGYACRAANGQALRTLLRCFGRSQFHLRMNAVAYHITA
jgi:hypothetical protein